LFKKVEKKAEQYLDTVTRSSLNEIQAGEEPKVLIEDTFDIFSAKVNECELEDLTIETSTKAPKAYLNKLKNLTEDCNRILDVRYYAF